MATDESIACLSRRSPSLLSGVPSCWHSLLCVPMESTPHSGAEAAKGKRATGTLSRTRKGMCRQRATWLPARRPAKPQAQLLYIMDSLRRVFHQLMAGRGYAESTNRVQPVWASSFSCGGFDDGEASRAGFEYRTAKPCITRHNLTGCVDWEGPW